MTDRPEDGISDVDVQPSTYSVKTEKKLSSRYKITFEYLKGSASGAIKC